MPTFEDLTGKRFGKLTVMYRAADYIQPSGQRKRMWRCVCDCGNECEVRAADLKTGNTTSELYFLHSFSRFKKFRQQSCPRKSSPNIYFTAVDRYYECLQ